MLPCLLFLCVGTESFTSERRYWVTYAESNGHNQSLARSTIDPAEVWSFGGQMLRELPGGWTLDMCPVGSTMSIKELIHQGHAPRWQNKDKVNGRRRTSSS